MTFNCLFHTVCCVGCLSVLVFLSTCEKTQTSLFPLPNYTRCCSTREWILYILKILLEIVKIHGCVQYRTLKKKQKGEGKNTHIIRLVAFYVYLSP